MQSVLLLGLDQPVFATVVVVVVVAAAAAAVGHLLPLDLLSVVFPLLPSVTCHVSALTLLYIPGMREN